MSDQHIPLSLILLTAFLPFVVGYLYYVHMTMHDIKGGIEKAIKAARKKYGGQSICEVPTARLPAFTAEPGVLVLFTDKAMFIPLGGPSQTFLMGEIRGTSFRSMTPDEEKMGGNVRILRLNTMADYWEFAVPIETERMVQGVFDYAGVKRSQDNVPPSATQPAPPRTFSGPT